MADLEEELRGLRTDIAWIEARLAAKNMRDRLGAFDEMIHESADMSKIERLYFERKGKLAPAILIKLSNWVRRKRAEYGL